MTGSSRAGAGALVAVLAIAGAARADAGASPPTEDEVEAARALYRQALDLAKDGKLAAAIERALEAYHTAATPVTALEAANLLVEARRLVEARDLARAVALLAVSPRESNKGRDARADAVALATSLDGRIPKIAFADRPASAVIVVDGKELGPVSGSAWQGVDPGAHSIVIEVGTRACTTIAASLAEGEERTFDLHGTAESCPGSARATPAAPPAADPSSPALRWAGAITVAAGVVAVGVGGAVALGAKSSYDSVAGSCPAAGCTQDAYDVRQSARSLADAATVTMIAGGTVAAVGAVLFFWPGGTGGPAETGVALRVGPREARLVVRF